MDRSANLARPVVMVCRGLVRRCPVCGSGGLFRRWFTIRDRCPSCGLWFERVEGHWIGAIAMNTVVSLGLMLGAIVVGIVLTYPDVPFGPVAGVSVAIALLCPVLFLGSSRTLWTAIDLWMRPPEPEEFRSEAAG